MGYDSGYGQVVHLSKRLRSSERGARTPAPRFGDNPLQEAFATRILDASATALILSSLGGTQQPLLWVTDRLSRRENGQLYTPGLQALAPAAPILHIEVNHPRDALWAMEEGAACGGLSAVVGEIHGMPSVLDFTATKRLALRADASGVPVWLIRSGASGGLSAARERWRISALPSDTNPHDQGAPGPPVWEAELFRARSRPPGRWEARHDQNAKSSPYRISMVSRSGDGPVARDYASKSDAAGG